MSLPSMPVERASSLEATFVVIEEVETENWGWGGLPVAEYWKKLAKAPRA